MNISAHDITLLHYNFLEATSKRWVTILLSIRYYIHKRFHEKVNHLVKVMDG